MTPLSTNMVIRAFVFAFLVWLPAHELLGLWSMMAKVRWSHNEPCGEDGFEYLFYSAPYPQYFVEAIAGGLAVIAFLWMLSGVRTPGWKVLGIIVIPVVAVSACLHLAAAAAFEDYWFQSWDFSPSALHPRTLSILLLDIEVAVIAAIVWPWRKRWLAAHKSQPIGSGPSGAEPAVPDATARAARKCHPALLAVMLVLVALLLVWGSTRPIPPSSEISASSGNQLEEKLKKIRKDEHPAAWLDAARDVAYGRDDAEAAKLWQEMIRLEEALYGPESRVVASDISFLFNSLLRAGRPAEAEPWLRRYLDYTEKTLGSDHQFAQSTRSKLAGALRDLGKFDEAKQFYGKMISVEARHRPGRPGKPLKLSLGLEKDYRALLTKMGETPESIQKQMDALTTPTP